MTTSASGDSGGDPPPAGATDGLDDALGSVVGDGSLDAVGSADAEGSVDALGSVVGGGSLDAVGSTGSLGSTEAVGGAGAPVGEGDPVVGDGDGVRLGVGAGRGAGVVVGGRGAGTVTGAPGRRAGARSTGVPAVVVHGVGITGLTGGTAGPTEGTTVTVGVGAPVGGGGTTTGPTEGVGMNGVLPSGSAVLPTVAEPVLIAARTGIEAVPASSATVSR